MKFEDIPKIIRDRMNVDEFIFGNAFCLLENGRYKRVDPMKVKLNRNSGEYEIIDEKEELLGIDVSDNKTARVFGIKHKDGTAIITRKELLGERNPAHYCMNCDKYLGFRGFCSRKCHNEWYDSLYPKEEKEQSKVIFGMDIITDCRIPKGTVCYGHKNKEGIVIIDKIGIYNLISESTIGLSLDQKARQLKFSDKNGNILWGYLKEDVKEHLKEEEDLIRDFLDKDSNFWSRRKEIFGERLI